MRVIVLAVVLALCAVLAAVGVGLIYLPAGLIVGAMLGACWAWLTFSGVPEPVEVA